MLSIDQRYLFTDNIMLAKQLFRQQWVQYINVLTMKLTVNIRIQQHSLTASELLN